MGQTTNDLQRRRLAAGLSQSEVAARIGVTQATVSNWEIGRTVPAPEQLTSLRKFLGDFHIGSSRPYAGETPSGGTQPFSAWLRGERARRGLSVAELAHKTGLSGQTVRGIESGRFPNPHEATRKALSDALGEDAPQSPVAEAEDARTPDDDPSPLAVWLNKTRTEKGLTVVELAKRAGITTQAIYNIEAGRIDNPRKGTRLALSRALNEAVPDDTLRETEAATRVVGLGSLTDFDPHDEKDLPDEPGVYVFYDVSQRPVYVGRSAKISGRVREHEQKFWFKRPIVDTASYIKIPGDELRKQVEQILIRFLKSNAVLNRNLVDRD